jgi:hypothetical protein
MSYGLTRSQKKILMGSIMKYMVILLRHNMYDRLWWPNKTDKAGLKDSKLTKYETESKIHWSNIHSLAYLDRILWSSRRAVILLSDKYLQRA